MQEFAHLCQEKDSKVVLSVLPLWPKVYAKLSIVSYSIALVCANTVLTRALPGHQKLDAKIIPVSENFIENCYNT